MFLTVYAMLTHPTPSAIALPLHKGWWTEGMFCKPLARAFHEKVVKSVIWNGLFDCAHIGARKAELKETKGEINQLNRPF